MTAVLKMWMDLFGVGCDTVLLLMTQLDLPLGHKILD